MKKVVLFVIVSVMVSACGPSLNPDATYTVFLDEEQGLYGFVNQEGDVIIKPRFQDAKDFSDGFAPVSNGHGWGYIDSRGKLIQFDKPAGQNLVNEHNSKYPFMEATTPHGGSAIVKYDYLIYVEHQDEEYGGEWYGLVNSKGKWIVNPKYIDYRDFYENIAAMQMDDGYWHLMTTEGRRIKPDGSGIRELSSFRDGVAVATDTGRRQYLLSNQGEQLGDKYINIEPISDSVTGHYVMEERRSGDALKGIIAGDGEEVIPAELNSVSFDEGKQWVIVGSPEGFGLYSAKFEPVEPYPGMDRNPDLSEDVAIISVDGKSGIINSQGDYVVDPMYSRIEPAASGKFTMMDEQGRWGLISDKFNISIEPQYANQLVVSQNLIKVTEDEKMWGYINETGEKIIPFAYESATDFSSDGVAKVTQSESLPYQEGGRIVSIDGSGRAILNLISGTVSRRFTYEITIDSQGNQVDKQLVKDGSWGRLVIEHRLAMVSGVPSSRVTIDEIYVEPAADKLGLRWYGEADINGTSEDFDFILTDNNPS